MTNLIPPNASPPAASPPESSGVASPPSTSGLAIAGFILSFLPFCAVNIVGLILGIVAWTQINKDPQRLKGKGLAIAAVVIGSLWLVIAVIGILAAIAIPAFMTYQTKAKQSEARVNLDAIYHAQKAFHEAHDRYADTFAELQWAPGEEPRYTYVIGQDQIGPAIGAAVAIPDDVQSFAGADEFRAAAVGNPDSDPYLDAWVIDQDRELDHVLDDITDSPYESAADVRFE